MLNEFNIHLDTLCRYIQYSILQFLHTRQKYLSWRLDDDWRRRWIRSSTTKPYSRNMHICSWFATLDEILSENFGNRTIWKVSTFYGRKCCNTFCLQMSNHSVGVVLLFCWFWRRLASFKWLCFRHNDSTLIPTRCNRKRHWRPRRKDSRPRSKFVCYIDATIYKPPRCREWNRPTQAAFLFCRS